MTTNHSLLESAAELRAKTQTLALLCDQLRGLNSDQWTTYKLAYEEATTVALDAMRGAWMLLDRFEQLARAEVQSLESEEKA